MSLQEITRIRGRALRLTASQFSRQVETIVTSLLPKLNAFLHKSSQLAAPSATAVAPGGAAGDGATGDGVPGTAASGAPQPAAATTSVDDEAALHLQFRTSALQLAPWAAELRSRAALHTDFSAMLLEAEQGYWRQREGLATPLLRNRHGLRTQTRQSSGQP